MKHVLLSLPDRSSAGSFSISILLSITWRRKLPGGAYCPTHTCFPFLSCKCVVSYSLFLNSLNLTYQKLFLRESIGDDYSPSTTLPLPSQSPIYPIFIELMYNSTNLLGKCLFSNYLMRGEFLRPKLGTRHSTTELRPQKIS